MLSRIRGAATPAAHPEAEMWMGSHPRGASVLVSNSGEETRIPENSVPFLFKILTARNGLSIQAHPSKIQAEEGYARENAAGIPVDAPHRNYRDTNHKPELMCALTDFYGLRGFRPVTAIAAELVQVCAAAEHLPTSFCTAVAALQESPDGDAWRHVFQALLETGEDPAYRAVLTHAAAHVARSKGTPDPNTGAVDRADRYWWVLELQRQFPDDPGTLAPLYLNLVHLRPGEAVYLDAQTLHAYLFGAGIEIMANSDNVLRAGCTSKHVDIGELNRVLSFRTASAPVITPTADSGVWMYPTPAAEFELRRIRCSRVPRVRLSRANGPAIVLAIGGTVRLSEGETTVRLGSGESAFLDGSAPDERRQDAQRMPRRGHTVGTPPAEQEVVIAVAEGQGGEPVAPDIEPFVFIAALPGAVTVVSE